MVYYNKNDEILKRVWNAVGKLGYDVRQRYDYNPVSAITESGLKQNYQIKKWLSSMSACIAELKKYGVKYVQGHYDVVRFYLDDTSIRLTVEHDYRAKVEKDKAELDAINILRYKPSQKVIEKLTGYFEKGSKVNVCAIKDPLKLLTYYYASVEMDWKDLTYTIGILYGWDEYKDAEGNRFMRICEAIRTRVEINPVISVGRSKAEDRLLEFSKNIWREVKATKLPFKFGIVSTTYDECWKDHKNGCAWTVAYDLMVGEKKIHFCDITNEGGGSFGYFFTPTGCLMNKSDFEDAVIRRIRTV